MPKEILEIIVNEFYEEVVPEPECFGSNIDISTGQVQSMSQFPQLTDGDNSRDCIGLLCYNHMALR